MFSAPYLKLRTCLSELEIRSYVNPFSTGRDCSIRKVSDSPGMKKVVSGLYGHRL